MEVRNRNITGTKTYRNGFHLRTGWAYILFAVTFLSVLGFPCQGAAQQVRAWVDKDVATLEDQITLIVSLSDEKARGNRPELPSLPAFRVIEGGSSSRIEIVNFKKTSSVQYTYFLLPKRAGVFTIGPVRVRAQGRMVESRPIQVRILPADQTPEERPAVFITQEVDDTTPYRGQQIVYTFRFFQRSRVLEAQWENPAFEDFWVEDLGKERQYETILGGQNYTVTEIRKALFPLSEGAREIPECVLTCKLLKRQRRPIGERSLLDDHFFSGSFFGRAGQTEIKSLRAKPISLDVRPLPARDRPEGFQGLVGTFRVRANVSDRDIRQGDSTTLTITVTGEGNLRDLVSLGPEEIPGFRIYPDKPSFELRTQGNRVLSERVFKKALVPLVEGALEIPAVQLSYFDPKEGEYRVARTLPIELSVAEGDPAETLPLVTSSPGTGSRTRIQVVGKDILPVHTGLSGARDQVPSGGGLLPYLVLLLAPPLAFALCFVLKRRKDRLEVDAHLMRRKQARRTANRALKEAKKQMSDLEQKTYYSHLSRSIKGLIGDKLNLSALAFTPAEIRRCLREQGVRKESVESLHAFLEELEYNQFVSGGQQTAEREDQYNKARKFVALLDKKL